MTGNKFLVLILINATNGRLLLYPEGVSQQFDLGATRGGAGHLAKGPSMPAADRNSLQPSAAHQESINYDIDARSPTRTMGMTEIDVNVFTATDLKVHATFLARCLHVKY